MKPFAILLLLVAITTKAHYIRRGPSPPQNTNFVSRLKDEKSIFDRYLHHLSHPQQTKEAPASKNKDIQWNIMSTTGHHSHGMQIVDPPPKHNKATSHEYHTISTSDPYLDAAPVEEPPSPNIVDDEEVDFQPASQLHNELFGTNAPAPASTFPRTPKSPKSPPTNKPVAPKKSKFISELGKIVQQAQKKYHAQAFAMPTSLLQFPSSGEAQGGEEELLELELSDASGPSSASGPSEASNASEVASGASGPSGPSEAPSASGPSEAPLPPNNSTNQSAFELSLLAKRDTVNQTSLRCEETKENVTNATLIWRQSGAIVTEHLASIESNFGAAVDSPNDLDIKDLMQSSADSVTARETTSKHRRNMDEAIRLSQQECGNRDAAIKSFNTFVDESISINVKQLNHVHTVIATTTKEYHALLDVARELTKEVEQLQQVGETTDKDTKSGETTNDPGESHTPAMSLTDKIIASRNAIHALKAAKEFLNGLEKRGQELQALIDETLVVAGRKEKEETEKKEQDDVIASDNWETSELKTLKEAVTTSVSASDSKVEEVETMQQQEKLVEVEEV